MKDLSNEELVNKSVILRDIVMENKYKVELLYRLAAGEEAVKEVERLKADKRELVEAIKESIKTCNGINTADYRTWEDGLNTKDEFIVWSKSRCGWQSDRLTAALEGKK
jgi:hypothetical protein